jgi:hypothetical protein
VKPIEQRGPRDFKGPIVLGDGHDPRDGLPVAGDDDTPALPDCPQELRESAIRIGGRDGFFSARHVVILPTLLSVGYEHRFIFSFHHFD